MLYFKKIIKQKNQLYYQIKSSKKNTKKVLLVLKVHKKG